MLKAVIEGLGPYPGVVERWEMYAPWLDCDWVHTVNFERLRDEPKQAAREILEYGFRRIIGCLGWEEGIRADDAECETIAQQMAEASRQTERSPTYREGKVGGWREAFTDEHKDLFKATDAAGWLMKLGYEEGKDW